MPKTPVMADSRTFRSVASPLKAMAPMRPRLIPIMAMMPMGSNRPRRARSTMISSTGKTSTIASAMASDETWGRSTA